MAQNEIIKIAIIMPIFQPCRVVDRALNIMNQQTKRDNIVVYLISDCSPYNYNKLIQKYKKTLNIVYLSTPVNSGPGIARNIALAKCPEKYIIFHDDDDFLSNEYVIENYIKAIQESSNFRMIYANNKIQWEDDASKIEKNSDFFLGTVFNKDFLDKHNIRFNKIVSRNHEDYLFFKQVEFIKDDEFANKIYKNFLSYTHYHDSKDFSICNYLDQYYSPRQTISEVINYILVQAEIIKFYKEYSKYPESKIKICKILKYFYVHSNNALRFIELISIRGLTSKELNDLYNDWKFILDLINKNEKLIEKFPEMDNYTFSIPEGKEIKFKDFYKSFDERFHNLFLLK